MSSCDYLFACFGILAVFMLCTGCTSLEIGDAGYSNGTISLSVTNTGDPSEGYVQVTIYEIRDNRQEEAEVFYAPLSLQPGMNTAVIYGNLEPGQYKFYFYLIQDGERKAAAIRDVVVT